MFLRERIDIDLAMAKIRAALQFPDIDQLQRDWLRGMMQAAEWTLGQIDRERPLEEMEEVRRNLGSSFRALRNTAARGHVGGQLVFFAWARFDNNNPIKTPSGQALQYMMEGRQLRSSVPLVGEKR